MEPLLAKETYATVDPLSRPLPTIKVEKEMDQDLNRPINPPTSEEFALPQKRFSETPEPPATPLPALPEEHRQNMPPAPVGPTEEIPAPSRLSGRISTQLSISYKQQLGHRVQHATSEIPDEDPTTYREAVNSSLKGEWTSAINDEIIALKKNKTLDVVNKPIRWNIVGSKWVFKTKKNADGTLERFQARAIVQGRSPAPGFDFEDTLAPVIQYESLRLPIAICLRNKWRPRHMDVKSAFLYSKLKDEVYMRPPPGFSDGDKVWKPNRYINGLKQSANEWYALFAKFLTSKDFTASHQDPCMFIHSKFEYSISLYVYAIAIYSADTPHLTTLINDLKTAYEARTSGKPQVHLAYISRIHQTVLLLPRNNTSVLSPLDLEWKTRTRYPSPYHKALHLRKGLRNNQKTKLPHTNQ